MEIIFCEIGVNKEGAIPPIAPSSNTSHDNLGEQIDLYLLKYDGKV